MQRDLKSVALPQKFNVLKCTTNSLTSNRVYVSLRVKMIFRVKQIGLALCLMMSLLIGHASACACSHHVEKKAVETSDCHSATAETVETSNDGNACDTSCICATDQPSTYLAANSISKKSNIADAAEKIEPVVFNIELRASSYTEVSPEFISDLSYSNTLKSLLPSRAPPRL